MMLINFTGDAPGPKIYRKGGGGGSSTTVEGLPKEFRPYIEKSLKDAKTAYDSGSLQHVQGLTPEQQDAYNRKLELGKQGGALDQIGKDSYDAAGVYRDAASGEGLFAADALGTQAKALEDSIGEAWGEQLGTLNTGASFGGTLGSARQSAATQGALARTGADIAQNELNTRRQAGFTGAQGVIGSGSQIGNQLGAGAKATEGVGSALQQQKQKEADAVYQGLERIFGLYGSAPARESSTTTSGGGK